MVIFVTCNAQNGNVTKPIGTRKLPKWPRDILGTMQYAPDTEIEFDIIFDDLVANPGTNSSEIFVIGTKQTNTQFPRMRISSIPSIIINWDNPTPLTGNIKNIELNITNITLNIGQSYHIYSRYTPSYIYLEVNGTQIINNSFVPFNFTTSSLNTQWNVSMGDANATISNFHIYGVDYCRLSCGCSLENCQKGPFCYIRQDINKCIPFCSAIPSNECNQAATRLEMEETEEMFCEERNGECVSNTPSPTSNQTFTPSLSPTFATSNPSFAPSSNPSFHPTFNPPSNPTTNTLISKTIECGIPTNGTIHEGQSLLLLLNLISSSTLTLNACNDNFKVNITLLNKTQNQISNELNKCDVTMNLSVGLYHIQLDIQLNDGQSAPYNISVICASNVDVSTSNTIDLWIWIIIFVISGCCCLLFIVSFCVIYQKRKNREEQQESICSEDITISQVLQPSEVNVDDDGDSEEDDDQNAELKRFMDEPVHIDVKIKKQHQLIIKKHR